MTSSELMSARIEVDKGRIEVGLFAGSMVTICAVSPEMMKIVTVIVLAVVAVPCLAWLMSLYMEEPPRLLPAIDSQTPMQDVLANVAWPAAWPFRPSDFRRQDETVDNSFYAFPRYVYHIDEGAMRALTAWYAQVLFDGAAVLDVCSSWVSHYPTDFHGSRVAGIGMNAAELARNRQLTEYTAKDLNLSPTLPFEDNSFDFVTLVVSVDYLIKPLEVFAEIQRVLKPGGLAIVSQSNRCFPSKAISIWNRTNDPEHAFIIGAYFHYAGGFDEPEVVDVLPATDDADPLFNVQARKGKAGSV